MVSGQETIFVVGAGSHSGWIQLYRTSHSLASAFLGVNSETTFNPLSVLRNSINNFSNGKISPMTT